MSNPLHETPLFEPQQAACDRRGAGFGVGVDAEWHALITKARHVDAAAGQAELGLAEIVEALGRTCVIELDRMAFAGAIDPSDHERAIRACEHLRKLHRGRLRVERYFPLGALHTKSAGRAFARFGL